MRTIWLRMRMMFCVAVMCAILFALFSVIGLLTGVGATPIFYAILALVIVGFQFMIGPKMVERFMNVRYVSPSEQPRLHAIIDDLATKAKIPKLKVGISPIPIPNAFAFGKTKRDARVCVTKELMSRLNEDELRAVLAHELSHIRHRDVVVITTLSVIPMICYFVFYSFLFSSMGRRRGASAAMAIALVAFVVYLITNLLVLYASRIREYYADRGSAELTGKPYTLASALYKIVCSTRIDKERLKSIEGMKAFFATDPSKARKEVTELRKADLDMDGHLDAYEVEVLAKGAKISIIDGIMELFSTHPNVVKRISRLSS
ncbi:MAG: zinc metalloprotease HtpX [Methanocellales archaeon]|nr:zinc metalloprotease HtpX [Methanocellales archaeon]